MRYREKRFPRPSMPLKRYDPDTNSSREVGGRAGERRRFFLPDRACLPCCASRYGRLLADRPRRAALGNFPAEIVFGAGATAR
jgi:hypothetical protein